MSMSMSNLLSVVGVALLAAVIVSGQYLSTPNVYNTGQGSTRIRVMTINIWLNGMNVNNGLQKVANQISQIQADIVVMQEVAGQDTVDEVCRMLGGSWRGITTTGFLADIAILTHFNIDDSSAASSSDSTAMGAIITLPSGQRVNTWSLHLDFNYYGPYAANDKSITTVSQMLLAERDRIQNVENLLATPAFVQAYQNANEIPLIVAGDFNSPSHLDWIESTRQWHGGWVFQWPVTVMLERQAGLSDSYRQIHPDPYSQPGNTWSTVHNASDSWPDYAIPEPQDRIDFILYRGQGLTPINSFIYSGTQPLRNKPDQADNAWPSDHYAVVTDFVVADSSGAGGNGNYYAG